MNDTVETEQPKRLECRASKDPALNKFIVAVFFLGVGIWCLLDRQPAPKAWDAENINEVASYLLNNWGPVVFLPVGAVFGLWGLAILRRRLVADDEGIGYAGKSKIRWDEISSVDATLLESKGYLLLHYGKDGKLMLDSWRLRDFRPMVEFVESHVPEDKIVT